MTFANILVSIWQWILAHPTSMSLGGFYVMSAFIGALQMPDNTSGSFYRFFFKFVNGIAANFSRAGASNTSAGYQDPKPDVPVGSRPPSKP